MAWAQIRAITAKDLKIFFKDPGAVLLIFLMPLTFVILMSYALAGQFAAVQDQPIRLLVLDGDGGPAAATVLERLEAESGFAIERSWQDRALDRPLLERLVASGERPYGLVLPAGLSDRLQRDAGPPVRVELIADPATPQQAVAPLLGTLRGLLERTAALQRIPPRIDALFDELARQAPLPLMLSARQRARKVLDEAAAHPTGAAVQVARRAPAGADAVAVPDAYQQNVPGYTLFGIFWIVVLLAESVLLERREGTFRRLLAAPVGRASLLAGKVLPYYLINLMQVVALFGVAALLFGMDLGGSIPGLVLVSLAASAAAVGLGVLVSALARTEAQTRGLTILVLLVLAALGGCFVPRFVMPAGLQAAGLATPHAWALEAYHDLLVRGGGLLEVLPEVAVLLAFALVAFTLGVWRFRFD